MLTHQHPHPAPNVLFSSRRRSRGPRSAPAAGQTRIPDWIWGAGLGLIVIIAIGGYFLLTSTGGGGGSRCDRALAPLGSSDISQQGFNDEDAGLTDLIERLQAGDLVYAKDQFYQGPTHAFTHNVEPPLREADEQAAKDLCEEVYTVEDVITFGGTIQEFAASLSRIKELLRDAAVILGYDRPGDVMNIKPDTEEMPYARST